MLEQTDCSPRYEVWVGRRQYFSACSSLFCDEIWNIFGGYILEVPMMYSLFLSVDSHDSKRNRAPVTYVPLRFPELDVLVSWQPFMTARDNMIRKAWQWHSITHKWFYMVQIRENATAVPVSCGSLEQLWKDFLFEFGLVTMRWIVVMLVVASQVCGCQPWNNFKDNYKRVQ